VSREISLNEYEHPLYLPMHCGVKLPRPALAPYLRPGELDAPEGAIQCNDMGRSIGHPRVGEHGMRDVFSVSIGWWGL